jgi:hypothetical protein
VYSKSRLYGLDELEAVEVESDTKVDADALFSLPTAGETPPPPKNPRISFGCRLDGRAFNAALR